jgi:prepilin-type processing-associated H-X9-DG protein
LRQQTNELATLRDENRRLRTPQKSDQPKNALQQKEDMIARMGHTRDWLIAFFLHADKNGGQFPASFEQASAFLKADAESKVTAEANRFEIVFQSEKPISSLSNPERVIVMREKEPWQAADGKKWSRIYGFADGHVEIHSDATGDFEAWEKKLLTPATTTNP